MPHTPSSPGLSHFLCDVDGWGLTTSGTWEGGGSYFPKKWLGSQERGFLYSSRSSIWVKKKCISLHILSNVNM